jgi:D-alanyl-D-alanine carboxypeptidase/D-alanyl-D-alanine-endopeptidase (penicillin-binding protein 4)
MISNFFKTFRYVCLAVCLSFVLSDQTPALDFDSLRKHLGPADGMVVSTPDNKIVFSHNAHTKLIPASTLKVLTAVAAFQYLGQDYRFKTEFYLDANSNLKIKGYGDPLLISEIIADICSSLHQMIEGELSVITDLVLDSTYFDQSVIIPGVTDSSEPYDAPNGALCVNFNTVNFKTKQGRPVSAESQTPLLPMTKSRIKKSGLAQGRITLSHQRNELTLYAGRLFKYFLEQSGFKVIGKVRLGSIKSTDKLVLVHSSPFSLKQVVAKMMAFSNNFMANQILIQTGISQSNPPGTLAKGVAAIKNYARDMHGLDDIQISEGAGISRQNRMSAGDLHRILMVFKPHYQLLRKDQEDFHKTGTLYGISTRVGFLGSGAASQYAYVILCNTPGRSAKMIRKRLQRILLSPLD